MPEPKKTSTVKIQRKRRRVYQEPAEEKTAAPTASSDKEVPAKETSVAEKVVVKKVVAEKAVTDESSRQVQEVVEPVEPSLADRRELVRKADKITTKYVHLSAGFGLIPIPLFDFATMIALQTLLVAELATIWGVPFSENRQKSLVMSFISGLIASSFATGGVGSLIKMIPVIGTVVGLIAYPVVAGASTYAIGKVFIKHFESGGTLLDFKPERVKAYYKEQFEKGKNVAESLKKK